METHNVDELVSEFINIDGVETHLLKVGHFSSENEGKETTPRSLFLIIPGKTINVHALFKCNYCMFLLE